ncbi:hypothetical protein BH11ARM2_BH11ARM2_01980 [soil metagenome]
MPHHISKFALSKVGAFLGSSLLLAGPALAGGRGFVEALAATSLFQERAPWYTDQPGPVFLGDHPSRDDYRGWWTDESVQAFIDARNGDGGDGEVGNGWLAMAGLEGLFTFVAAPIDAGSPIAGEGAAMGGGSGSGSVVSYGDGGGAFPNGGGMIGNPGGGVTGQTNTNTGNKLSELPIVGWGSRGDSNVDLVLYHNSANDDEGAFGYGWTFSYNAKINTAAAVGSTPAYAFVNMPDGLAVPFAKNAATGLYARPAGYFGGLVKNAGGTWTLTMRDGSVMDFDTAGRLSSLTDRFGNATTVSRNGTGQVTYVTSADGRQLAFGYTGSKVTSVTDPLSRVWTFGYTTAKLTGVGYPHISGGSTPTRSFTYDSLYNILTETDLNGKVWTSTYDGSQRQASWTDPTSRAASYSYTSSATTMTLPGSGRTVVHNYSSGLLASVVDEASYSDARTYDSDRNLTGYIDARGKSWSNTFDSNGNTLTVTNPLSKAWTYTYTSLGDVATTTDPLGHVTTYTYTSGKLTKMTDALSHDMVQYTYNSYGDVLTSQDALGRTTTYTRNSQADADSVTDPAGVDTTYHYDVLGRMDWVKDHALDQTSFSYDLLGRLTGITNPGGSGQTLGYDLEGRLTSRQDEIGRTTSQSYDDAGRPLVTIDGNGDTQTNHYTTAGFVDTVTDGNSHTRTYTRTLRGEPASLTLADGAYEQWSHNGSGDVTAHIDPLSRTTGYTFDDAGQMTAIDRPVATDVSISYDDAGRQTTMTDGTGTTTWTFDNANRLTTLDQPNGKQVYGYNNAGQRTSMGEYPSGGGSILGTTTYSYGSTSGRLDSLTNRLSQTTTYAYDAQGRLSVRTLKNGAYETTTYDARSRVDTITLRKPDTTVIRSHDYGYDDAGQVTSHQIDAVTTSYGYDGAGQLTSEARTGYSASYNYDHNHNRTSRTVGSTTHDYAYDGGDKLLTVKIGATTVRSYTYDAAGQPTAVTESAGTTNLVWDDDARMTSLTPPSASAQTHAYNAFGAQTSAVVPLGSLTFARDGVGATAPALRDGQADFTPGISETRSGNSRFLSSDLLNTDVMSNGSGAASAKRTYDAFGRIDTYSGATWTGPSGYGGAYGYQEDGSGLSLLGNRWYDSEVGRFLTRDPIKDGRNWYVYCGNNPISGVDPTGLDYYDPAVVEVSPNFKGKVFVIGDTKYDGDNPVMTQVPPGYRTNPGMDVDIVVVVQPNGEKRVYFLMGIGYAVKGDPPEDYYVADDGTLRGPNYYPIDEPALLPIFHNWDKDIAGAKRRPFPKDLSPTPAPCYYPGKEPWNAGC